MTTPGRIVFCGGGSGGHVFPLLAVYHALPAAVRCRVVWWGSCRGVERTLVAREGIAYRVTPCGKFRRYFSWRTAPDMLAAMAGLLYCLVVFLLRRPSLVLSKGGYVALPVALAAGLLRVPVLTHESDLTPGLATRLIARFARKVLLGWEESVRFFPTALRSRLLICGNPVRAEFYRGDATAARQRWKLAAGRPLLLVLGGSLGAEEVNLLVSGHIESLLRDYQVVHQHGKSWRPEQGGAEYRRLFAEACAAQAEGKTSPYLPLEFIEQGMADLMAASTAIVARAGAGFLSELLAAARPALLVPLRGSGGSRGEQCRNAASFQHAGLAEVLDPEEHARFPERVGDVCAHARQLSAALRAAGEEFRPAEAVVKIVVNELDGVR